MKKLFKCLSAVLALCLAVSVGVIVSACGDGDKDNEVTEYTVTLKYDNGNAVDGTKDGNDDFGGKVKIQLCDADNENKCFAFNFDVDASGKCTIPLSKIHTGDFENVKKLAVHVIGMPAGYTYSNNYVISSDNAEITVTLNKTN